MAEIPRQFSAVEQWIQNALRVPPFPQPPEGSAESIQVFRAGANYFKLCMLVWFVSHVLVLTGLVAAHFVVSTSLARMPEWAVNSIRGLEWLIIVVFMTSVVFTFFSQRLNYALRWYIVTDRSLRIRTGIFSLQELTMTFSNIQEIRVTAGPLQNFLKLADVEVQSAGGGSKGAGASHIGRFKSVSNANVIRDLMVERLRRYRDSGLGEPVTSGDPASDNAIDAARAVLAEAKALREQLTSSSAG
jgi:uncharacterized membrane protein YdbT with pleckstrin-like domain